MTWLASEWDISCLITCFTWSVRSKTVKTVHLGGSKKMLISSAADFPSTRKSCLTDKESGTTETAQHVFLVVRCSFRSSSGSGGQGLREKPAMLVTSAIIHIHWRTALTELPLVFTPNGRNGLAVHACLRFVYARGSVLHMEADKACLVHGHHCEHARTQEAERTQSNEAIAWLL